MFWSILQKCWGWGENEAKDEDVAYKNIDLLFTDEENEAIRKEIEEARNIEYAKSRMIYDPVESKMNLSEFKIFGGPSVGPDICYLMAQAQQLAERLLTISGPFIENHIQLNITLISKWLYELCMHVVDSL